MRILKKIIIKVYKCTTVTRLPYKIDCDVNIAIAVL